MLHWECLLATADLLVIAYVVVLSGLSIFGLHRAWLLVASVQLKPPQRVALPDPPFVTVQLPLYNEREVARRIILAAAALLWPRDRLEIQVLDDSTDDSMLRVDAAVAEVREAGVAIEVIRREVRTGFKAGALERGMETARGEVIAIFDADFVPHPDFLERVVPCLGEGIGMVQARWGHLEVDGWLRRAQAILLDGHFVLDHGGRHAVGHWFNFNGTAGIWRREAIEQAGGWQHDTLTEDLDLSYRAQLAGWRFVYASDVLAPAELPPTMTAFKSQQHRWAKGSVQTGRKLLGRIWRSDAPLGHRLEAVFHLVANAAWPLAIILTLLLPWMGQARLRAGLRLGVAGDLALFSAALLPLIVAYLYAIFSSEGSRWERLLAVPTVLALGMGMGLAQTKAAIEGLGGAVGEFVRTPKRGDAEQLGYQVRVHGTWLAELVFATYLWMGFGWAAWNGDTFALPFLLLFAVGYSLVGGSTALDLVRQRQSTTASAGSQVTPQSQGPSDQEPVSTSSVASTR